jgi:heme exporter protein A
VSALARRSLEVEGLAVSRGPATLFRDVAFRVESGEWLAIRGPNGSGKTTLLRCIAGLTRPERGTVRWNSHPAHVDRDDFNAELLYAGHLAGIKDDLSAEENLDGALRLRGHAIALDAIRSALEEAGLGKRRHLPARRLSAGQRRRIGLARLMLDPAGCWMLDEPITALDDDGQAMFSRLLRSHLDRGGLAVIATHHDLAPPPAREWRFS